MKLISEKVEAVIAKESVNINTPEIKKNIETLILLNALHNTGLIKSPTYNLHLVDTSGKSYRPSFYKLNSF